MSDYAESASRFLIEYSRNVDTSMFTGWASGHWHSLSNCCNAETYVKFGDYYGGYPSCKACDRTLGPDGFHREWVPPRKLWETDMECPWPLEPPA